MVGRTDTQKIAERDAQERQRAIARERAKPEQDRHWEERNKNRMRTEIANLSSWFSETRRSAAWSIAYYIGEERKQKSSVDYGSYSAINAEAISKLVDLSLADKYENVRKQAN